MAGGFDEHPEHINRKGAPKKEWTWAGVYRAELEKVGDDKKTVKSKVAKAIIAKAIEGDVQAVKEIANRTDGMPRQNIGLDGGEDGGVIKINITNYGDTAQIQTKELSDTPTKSDGRRDEESDNNLAPEKR